MTAYKRPPIVDNTIIRQLFDYIDNYHEEFCRVDDPEKKSDALRLLKGYAAEYLNKVSHKLKFQVASVERVLTQSINKPEFDPREASGAFEHLAKYGQNLLDQPWREEFRTLFLSSGYYVHNIQHYLHNPHEILVSMGYTNIDDSTLQLALPLNSSELKKISRDCFLASQECLIIGQIIDYVQSETKQSNFPPSRVFLYRKEYQGDITIIGRRICFDIHKHRHDESLKMQVKQQQQAARHNLAQEFDQRMELDCPVGFLVDVDDAMNGMKVGGDIPEREIVQKILRNTEREQEHIYDPVSFEDPNNITTTTNTGKFQTSSSMHNLSPSSPSINSSSSNFIYPSNEPSAFVRHPNNYIPPQPYNHLSAVQGDFGLPDPEQYQKSMEQRYYPHHSSTRSSTASPYIPQTVSAYFSNPDQNAMIDGDRKPSHYSSSSSSGGLSYPNNTKSSQVALQKHKISQEELRRMATTTTDNTNKSGPHQQQHDTLNKPDWIEKYHATQQQYGSSSKSRSRQPLAAYSENISNPQMSRTQESSSTSLDDSGSVLLQEALQYKNQVNSSFAVKSRKSTSGMDSMTTSSQPYQILKSVNRGPREDREVYNTSHHRKSSDSEREFGGNKSSGSSSEASSSWGYSTNYVDNTNVNCTTTKPTHFLDQRKNAFDCCDSVPVTSEYQSQFTKKATTPPTETNLDSLDTVYYKHLVATTTDQNQENYHHYPSVHKNDEYPSKSTSSSNRHKKSFPQQQQQHTSDFGGSGGIVKETNLDDDDEPPPSYSDVKSSSQNQKMYNSQPKKPSSSTTSTLDKKEKKIKERQREAQENELVSPPSRWTCPHCTFINYKEEEDKICDICAKSRDFVAEDSNPEIPPPSLPKLYSPGYSKMMKEDNPKKNFSPPVVIYDQQVKSQPNAKEETKSVDDDDTIECPHCTVVNARRRNMCECCGLRLRNMDD